MRLLMPPPPGRTPDQLTNHYRVEKTIADRLKSASRQERKALYATMYDELFRRVPDHPRLVLREDEATVQRANAGKMALVRGAINASSVFAEFAPGDCRFALDVARCVKTVHAIDISDQRGQGTEVPVNFSLLLYDGYDLNGIEPGTVDVVFSDQFIEHLHPEDARAHFEMACRLLKPGGRYIFRTPHAFTGPHDVSRYFSDMPQGFHLKEWTHGELRALLSGLGYSRIQPLRYAKGFYWRVPFPCVVACEALLGMLPRRCKRSLACYLVPSICLELTKSTMVRML